MRGSRVALLAAVLILTQSIGARGGTYSVSFTGAATQSTTEQMGLGLGHASESAWAWMAYMKPTAVRLFVTSISNWRNFIDSRKPRWGVSVSGSDVTTKAAWQAAVAELRQGSAANGDPTFREFLEADDSIRWSTFYKSLTETSTSQYLRCLGNPQATLEAMHAVQIRVLAVWHVTCKNLALSVADAGQAEYWRQRWELYRWMYAGGRFLAANFVNDVELYNEPDLDLATCLTPAAWVDEYELRSLALQHAYADHSAWSGQATPVTVAGPPASSPRYEAGTAGKVGVQHIREVFASGASPQWTNQQAYSYHQYNAPSYGMRSANDKLSAAIRKDDGGKALPIRVTEHNCYSDSKAQAVAGVDVMNSASVGACVAGQAAAILGRVQWSSVQKATQTPSNKPAGVIKNGLMWGDAGGDMSPTNAGFCAVGGTTKTAEAYRLVLQRTPGKQKLYGMVTVPAIKQFNNNTLWTVQSPLAYHVYSANYDKVTQAFAFSFAKLPGVPPSAPTVLAAVTSSLHNEVAALRALSAAKTMSLKQPRGSTYMLTVPRVPTATVLLTATDDTTLMAGDNMASTDLAQSNTLSVWTSNTNDQSTTHVALLKFDAAALPAGAKIVAAVLQLTLAQPPPVSGIYTVLGGTAQWTQATASWSSMNSLLLSQPSGKAVTSISRNFINWGPPGMASSPSVVGHVTVSKAMKGGRVLSLEVTDYVKGGGSSFAVARLHRFDSRGAGAAALKGDSVAGSRVLFRSMEAATGKPVLRVIYAT